VWGCHPKALVKKVLDEISHEEIAKGCPDITFLLKKKKTGYPSQINFQAVEGIPDAQQKGVGKEKITRNDR
jgi:hypothetical protein